MLRPSPAHSSRIIPRLRAITTTASRISSGSGSNSVTGKKCRIDWIVTTLCVRSYPSCTCNGVQSLDSSFSPKQKE